MTQLPADVARLLDGVVFAHLATLMPDGSPHSIPVWAGLEIQQHEGEVTWYAPIELAAGVDRSDEEGPVLEDPAAVRGSENNRRSLYRQSRPSALNIRSAK